MSVQVAGDTLSVGIIIGVIVGWLPTVAALLSIVWLVMNIVIHWTTFTTKLKGIFKRNK